MFISIVGFNWIQSGSLDSGASNCPKSCSLKKMSLMMVLITRTWDNWNRLSSTPNTLQFKQIIQIVNLYSAMHRSIKDKKDSTFNFKQRCKSLTSVCLCTGAFVEVWMFNPTPVYIRFCISSRVTPPYGVIAFF